MKVDLVRTEDMKQIYLNQLKTYPGKCVLICFSIWSVYLVFMMFTLILE